MKLFNSSYLKYHYTPQHYLPIPITTSTAHIKADAEGDADLASRKKKTNIYCCLPALGAVLGRHLSSCNLLLIEHKQP